MVEPRKKKARVQSGGRSHSRPDTSSFNLNHVYQQCCNININNGGLLHQLEEAGIIEIKLWPLLCKASSEGGDTCRGEGGIVIDSESDAYKAAFLLLKLINVRTYKLSKSEMNGPLSFMKKRHGNDDDDQDQKLSSNAFRLFLQTIVTFPKHNHCEVIQFLITAYSNMTNDMSPILQGPLLDLVGIGMWDNKAGAGSGGGEMSPRYRDLQLRRSEELKTQWNNYKSSSGEDDGNALHTFLPKIIGDFLSILKCQGKDTEEDDDDDDEDGDSKMTSEQTSTSASQMKFMHTTLQCLIDLLSNTSTRRYLRPYLLSVHLSTKCKLSEFHHRSYHNKNNDNNSTRHQSSNLFQQLTQILQQLETFAIEDSTSKSLSYAEMASVYHERAHILQKLCHRHHPDTMSEIIYAGVGMICSNESFLRRNFARVVDVNVLVDLCHRLRLLDRDTVEIDMSNTAEQQQQQRMRKLVTEIL
eukprot:CAMPEP_0204638700 /NCGR_PEP_ID=MMETSP0717-20131115/40148_1 /ASSEMBLY_ACC=CAM_ASM_000666 /TAXON_ID=230516 /ORGANISM="Chaetoceros curvisetus" /LENGTH=469 /DNA_ID=CAMNT_0051658545 /DNA_START=318 /DNA_END=1724 /DNA_ORIENTATION=+